MESVQNAGCYRLYFVASYYASFFLIVKSLYTYLHSDQSFVMYISFKMDKRGNETFLICWALRYRKSRLLGLLWRQDMEESPRQKMRAGKTKSKGESTQTVLVKLFLIQPPYFHLQEHFKPDIFRKLEVVLTIMFNACFKPQNHFTVSIFSKNTHGQ